MSRQSLARSLRMLTLDPVGRSLLGGADADALETLTAELVTGDTYGERAHLEAALARVGRPGEAYAFLRHLVWCGHREAAWRAGRLDPATMAASLVIEGGEWARETEGHATVLVSPMTVALSDASWVIAHALGRLAPERRVIVYGDGLDAGSIGIPEIDARMAGDNRATLRAILEVLAAGGVFCTYADFVYQEREAVQIELFGVPRAISSAFVGMAARPNTMLLPCVLTRGDGDAIHCRFTEPTLVTCEPGLHSTEQRVWQHRSVAHLVGAILEALIAREPLQWQLLATLSFDSPQMERG